MGDIVGVGVCSHCDKRKDQHPFAVEIDLKGNLSTIRA